MAGPYTIALPVAGQQISASLFGKAVRDAINDIDARMSALEAFTTGKPMGKIQQLAAQSIADNTDTALQFPAADVYDTHNFHDPAVNNTRIIPSVAGYYRFTGSLYLTGRTDFSAIGCWFRKNGSANLPPGTRRENMTNAVNFSLEFETIVNMNGSTDYVEGMTNQDNTANTATNTAVAGQFSTTIMWEFVRGL